MYAASVNLCHILYVFSSISAWYASLNRRFATPPTPSGRAPPGKPGRSSSPYYPQGDIFPTGVRRGWLHVQESIPERKQRYGKKKKYTTEYKILENISKFADN
jgi:hypothetical protein